MRIIVLLFLFLTAIGSSRAQIFYTDVNPDETYSLFATSFGQFDVTGNGLNDVLVVVGQQSGQNFINFTTPSFGMVGSSNVEQLISTGANVARLNAGASIGPSGTYGQGNTVTGGVAIKSPADWPNGTTDAYVGFRFTRLSSGTVHYGWIRIDVTNNRSQVTIKDFAYETTPNTPILAGDQGTIPVSSITISSQSGANTITTNGGTLQMVATVLPANASNPNVTWSVVPGTGNATIDASGLLTATADGTVDVVASAQDGSGVTDTFTVTISNQIILVNSIVVNTQSGATTITTNGGTLQMTATISPSNAANTNVTWSVIPGTGDASITTGGLLTASANGTVTVRATAQDGSGVFGEMVITISNQIIQVSSISVTSQTGGYTISTNNGTLQMVATVSPSNATNQNVTWSVIPGTGDASINASGLLTAIDNGTVTVRATAQDGSGVTGDRTVTISNQITLVSSITVTSQSGDTTITTDGGTLQMLATVLPANATNSNVTWSVVAGTGDASINTSGLLTAIDNGTVTVRAIAQDGSGVVGEQVVVISGQIVLVSGIVVSTQSGANSITVDNGTLQMVATVSPSNATNQNVTWSVIPGTGDASINSSGLLTAIDNGAVTVRATAADGSGQFDEITINISNQITLVSSITVGGQGGATSITTNGGSLQMQATVSPANASNQSVTWSVIPGTGDASINASGVLTAISNGTVTVRATAQDGSGIFGDEVITISNQIVLVSSITVVSQSGATTITTNGGDLQMLANISPSNATNQNVTWSVIPGTGDAIINSSGLLTAVANGTVTVRATAQDGSGVFGDEVITISNQIVLVSSITITSQSGGSTISTNGGTLQMQAAVTPTTATNPNVTWSVIPGTGDATISASGLLTATANGQVVVRADAQDGSGVFDEFTVTISGQIVLVTGITVSSQSGATTITTNGGDLQMLASITPTNATNQNVTWSVIPGTGDASINASGLLTAIADGTVTVRATAQDGSGVFDDFTVTISGQIVLVTGITVSSQSGASTITTNGGTLQMLATVSPTNATNPNVIWSVVPGTGNASINASGLLTASSNGTVDVVATAQDGSGVTGTFTVTISNQAPPTIVVTGITVTSQSGATSITTNGGILQMVATVTPSNATNPNVTWSVNPLTGDASIDAAGVLTAIADGTVEVIATAQDGSGVTGSLTITLSNQIILVSDITLTTQSGATSITTNGGTLQMVANITPTNATNPNVTWSVINGSGSATISASGLLTATGNGTVTVRADAQDASGEFATLVINISGQVVQVSGITVTSQSGATTITTNGGTLQMIATITPSNATNQNVTWSVVPGTGDASINSSGVLTAIVDGTVDVVATAQDGSGVTGSLTITISGQVILVSNITLTTQSGGTAITTNGGTLQMIANITPTNATNPNVTWTVINGSGSATINASGLLTATGNGTVTVRAEAQDGSGEFATLPITISGQIVLVSGITVSSQSGATTITASGGTLQMLATITPSNATNQNITWTVIPGTGTATINASGLLTATSNGTVTVRAEAQDGSGQFGTLTITINNQVILVSSIAVQGQGGASTISTNGGTLQMEATITPSNASNTNVTWSVAPGTGNANISTSGLLTATANGTVTVIATAQDGSGVTGSATITISGQIIPVSSITVTSQSGATTISSSGGTLQMIANVLPANATNPNVTWSVIPGTGAAVINGSGLLTAQTNGTVTVRATAQDGSGQTGDITITISNQLVFVNGITVQGQGGVSTITTNGGTLQMEAIITPSNATNQNVTWTVSPGTGNATINASGLLTATANGTVTVIATAQDGSGTSGNAVITISGQIIPVSAIDVTSISGDTTITASGGSLQMVANITPTNATNQNVSWAVTPGTGTAFINASGLLTAQTNGTVTVRATAQDGSGVFGEQIVLMSNQTNNILVASITVQGQGGNNSISVNGGFLQMQASILPINATNQNVSWSVTPLTGNATITSTGVLQALANGTVEVVATAQDASGTTGSQVVTISNQNVFVPVTDINISSVSGATVITTNGGSLQMQAGIVPTNATIQTVQWSVTPAGGDASITAGGNLFAIDNGNVWVVARAQDGSGVRDSILIGISNQAAVIPVTNIDVIGNGGGSSISMPSGTLQLFAIVQPTNATNTNVNWRVNPVTGNATVDQAGLLRAVPNGNGTIWAVADAQDGSGVADSLLVTISNQLTIGVEEVANISALSLFPNPVDAYFNLRFESAVASTLWLQVYDTQGCLLMEREEAVQRGENQLRIEAANNWPSGAYLIRLKIGEQQQTLRFLKR